MRRIPYTPAVFVRVANKELSAYGTWKNIRKTGGGTDVGEGRITRDESRENKKGWAPSPCFCVSVDS
jgi:hypothetical protein